VDDIADPLCRRFLAGDDLIEASKRKQKAGSKQAPAVPGECITLRAVLHRLRSYDQERLQREQQLVAALKQGAPPDVPRDAASLDAHVAALRALSPRSVRF
jgi:hypothetical protein